MGCKLLVALRMAEDPMDFELGGVGYDSDGSEEEEHFKMFTQEMDVRR